MNDLLLKFKFHDRAGRGVYEIREPILTEDSGAPEFVTIGVMRFVKGGVVSVEWADEAYAPNKEGGSDGTG